VGRKQKEGVEIMTEENLRAAQLSLASAHRAIKEAHHQTAIARNFLPDDMLGGVQQQLDELYELTTTSGKVEIGVSLVMWANKKGGNSDAL
jgi:hypothetical protein